jgi:hypothetical protein
MKKFIFFSVVICALLSGICQAQWQPDVRLTNDPAESYTSYSAWCIAASGQVVHVVWYDERNLANYAEIYYKRSTDAGMSWSADVRLTNDSAESWDPSFSLSGSVVHVVWYDNRDGNTEIYYKRSIDGGSSWGGADTRLTNNSSSSSYPSVAVSGSVVHVVWQDFRDGNREIYYKRSTEGGISWEADTRLTNYTADSRFPSVSVSGQVVHVVWYDTRDGNQEIYYKRSTDGGVSWGTDTRLTNNPALSELPSVSVSGSVVHVVWRDTRDGNSEIYYKRSTDGGVSWGADTRLTYNTADSRHPIVSVSDQVLHVVWHDNRHGAAEIYYKRSTDGGISWEADTRLTNNSAESRTASVSVSGTVVHVVWQDDRDGNYEIYYKRDPTGNPTVPNQVVLVSPSDGEIITTDSVTFIWNQSFLYVDRYWLEYATDSLFTNSVVDSSITDTTVTVFNLQINPYYWWRVRAHNSVGWGSFSDIWSFSMLITGLREYQEIPTVFSLSQNYPNPFNPNTAIQFSIPEQTFVKLEVFNTLGEKVSTLVAEELNAGSYKYDWNAGNLPSGIYYYSFTTNSFTQTKKLVLIK